jgi:hypothetical protein
LSTPTSSGMYCKHHLFTSRKLSALPPFGMRCHHY